MTTRRRATSRKLRVVRWHLLCGRCSLCRRWLMPDDPPGTWGYWCPSCQAGWWMWQEADVLVLRNAGQPVPAPVVPWEDSQRRWARACCVFAHLVLAWKQEQRKERVV